MKNSWQNNPLAHRGLYGILKQIANAPSEEAAIEALRKAPRAVSILLHFAYGPHEFDLPKGHIPFTRIDPRAFVEDNTDGDTDLFMGEVFKLHRLFVEGIHPTLTSKRRLELWRDVLARVGSDESRVLEVIRRERYVPLKYLDRDVVEKAFPGLLNQKPLPEESPNREYTMYSNMEQIPIAEAALSAPAPRQEVGRPMTAQEIAYQRLMRATFG